MSAKEKTKQRILSAALELLKEHGYQGTTTRLIAETAGCNEVTLFRHFGNKQTILEKVVEGQTFGPSLKETIDHAIIWDLEKDLFKIAHGYLQFMRSIEDFVMLGFKEFYKVEELNDQISRGPKEFKLYLTSYFEEMQKRNLIISTDCETLALNFIWINFGYFISKARFGDRVTTMPDETFLRESVQLFVRGVTP
ncbi:TetR/AcrR family transcriptional regulator [Alkalicoccobacillus plakortidis]|jgi:AcrR family transcriptional regulator|uniref:TetR/AcrR family transcriptional regulator n=1 Tax=Alkalicoccobacillus plakortidis TaxID=444060 RepID=A0ABT0XLU7_9BACI|nr:TetR/AcrR family transcriptional regulator [Alkalicoccobacillus plakortidis]MCM2676883.1 TetR/AcrR family transcriptional regulator [Alkalicoccobacillus plakortidis]